MKRFLLAPLAALVAVLLFSSCTYDPLYGAHYGSGYYGSGYYGSGYYGGPAYTYSGGYYNGVYSDFYVGFYNNSYRYRHTRCSHCNYYPCRGGHVTHYHTYVRNYRKPLYQRSHRGHDHGHASHRSRSSSYERGDSYRHQGIFGDPRSRSRTSPAQKTNPSAGYGTLRNSTPYPSSRSSGTPSRVRGSGAPSPRVAPHSVVSPSRNAPSPQVAPRSAPVQVKSAPAPSSGSQSSRSAGSSSSRSSPFSRNESKGLGRGSSRGGRGR